MHFDANIVDVRIVLRQVADHLSGAEADLEAQGRAAPEDALQIQGLVPQFDAVGRPMILQGALLRRRQPARSQHETSNVSG